MPKILSRLARQLRARGVKNPYAMATAMMQKHGLMKRGTKKLTAKGARRNRMSPAQRARSRAAKYSKKHKPSEYKYNRKTNRAKLK